jgi:EAL domain-containing protein (putative c-di-GMP-specific phosphodiesterase class I)
MLNTLSLNKYEAYQPEVLSVVNNNCSPSELRHAIYDNELKLQYQPRYDSRSGQLVMLEALARWRHPAYGLLPPDKFICIAEENELICALGLWAFEQSCKDMVLLRKQLNHQIKMAVNVSLLQCNDALHAQKLDDICQRYNLSLDDFELELTESKSIKNMSRVLRFCETLIALGAEISLDDFGTGYSPLNNLCDLPVHTIKIDQCFIKEIGNGGRSEILIHHLVELAHEMNVKVVAEGVENACQRDNLIDMECDQLQGFLMCRPLDPENITSKHIDIKMA